MQKKELDLERSAKIEIASSLAQREEIREWYYRSINLLNRKIQERWTEYHELQKKIKEIFYYKKDPEKEREKDEKRRRDAEHKKKKEKEEEDKKREEKRKKSENKKRPQDTSEKPNEESVREAEKIAIQELGISSAEYKAITSRINTLNDSELLDLIKRIFDITATDKKSVKSAYYHCAKKWHPDVHEGGVANEIKGVKIRVANNLYGMYTKRFARQSGIN